MICNPSYKKVRLIKPGDLQSPLSETIYISASPDMSFITPRQPSHTPLGVPTDLQSVVKKGSTYQTWGFVIPLIHKILQIELLVLH